MRGYSWQIVICVLTTVLSGCELDTGENFHFGAMEITEAAVPESFMLNSDHEIDVSIVRVDDCTFFEGFDVFEISDRVLNIVAIGSVLTNEDCTVLNDTISSPLRIRVVHDGTYRLLFYSGDDADGDPIYLEYEVPMMTAE